MEKKIKKLIIGFFVMMAALTLLSRVAASAMVAKVQTAAVNGGNLSFEIKGTGVVNDDAKKYIRLLNGYIISEIAVSAGQHVEKGDLLFIYDLEQLQEGKTALEKELKELQINYEKTELGEADSASVTEAAQQSSEADEDLKLAGESLEDMKNDVKENKQEQYNTAKEAYEEAKQSQEDAIETASRAVEDAKAQLTQLTKRKIEAEETLQDYKAAVISFNTDAIAKAHDAVFDVYYGGKYSEHLKEVNAAQLKLTRAQEDLQGIKDKWDQQIKTADNYLSYQTMLLSKDLEVKSAGRTVADLQETLDDLTKKDKVLEQAISDYNVSIRTGVPGDFYNVLYKIIYDNLNLDEAQIDTAQTKVDRAKMDETRVQEEWDNKVEDANAKVKELQADLSSIKNGSYDYSKDLRDSETQLRNAQRSAEAANFGLQKAEGDYADSKRLTKQELASIKIDIEDKQEELKQVQALIDNQGKVKSPVAGNIQTADMEEGVTLNGQEKLTIGIGGYELDMKANKKDMKNFEKGDPIDITINDNQGSMTSEIESIGMADQDGNVSFTALLPQGEYQTGAALDFDLQKASEDYSRIIPIQALRQDNKGIYILLAKESDSVLGKIQTAFRVEVKVIAKDAESAAVDASLSEDDQIIIGSNKNISEGDRVRIVETQE